MNKSGLTLIEVIVSCSILMIFAGSIFTILSYVSKYKSNISIHLTQSNILHNTMEETKIKMKTEINTTVNENRNYTYVEKENKYSVENSISEINNKKDLYKIYIEIKKEGENLKDNIVSYYFNLIGYEPQYYNEIPINTEEIYGLNVINNNE